MISDDVTLSRSGTIFWGMLKDISPDLQEFARVAGPTEEWPFIEPNSVILVIPARDGFLFDELYVETRKADILVAMGIVPHSHISWWSEEVVEKQIAHAIRFIKDILEERVIFIKQKALLSKKESYCYIRAEELSKKKRVLAVYSWSGTYDIEKQ